MTDHEKPATNGRKKPRQARTKEGENSNLISSLKSDHKAVAKLLDAFDFGAADDAKRRSVGAGVFLSSVLG